MPGAQMPVKKETDTWGAKDETGRANLSSAGKRPADLTRLTKKVQVAWAQAWASLKETWHAYSRQSFHQVQAIHSMMVKQHF